MGWKFMPVPRVLKLAGLGNVLEPLKDHCFDCVVFVRNGLGRVHALNNIYAFLERLLHFLVIEPVGRRILQPLAVNQRNTAPAADQWDKVWLLTCGGRALTFQSDLSAMLEKLL